MKKIIKYKKWEKIPWNSIQIYVYYLQNKIFYHAKNDEIVELHHHLDSNGKRTGKVTFVHGHCHDQLHSTKK